MVWTVNEVAHMMEVRLIFCFGRNLVNGIATNPDSAPGRFRPG